MTRTHADNGWQTEPDDRHYDLMRIPKTPEGRRMKAGRLRREASELGNQAMIHATQGNVVEAEMKRSQAKEYSDQADMLDERDGISTSIRDAWRNAGVDTEE